MWPLRPKITRWFTLSRETLRHAPLPRTSQRPLLRAPASEIPSTLFSIWWTIPARSSWAKMTGLTTSRRNLWAICTTLWLSLPKPATQLKEWPTYTFQMKIWPILTPQSRTKTFSSDLSLLWFTGRAKSKNWSQTKILRQVTTTRAHLTRSSTGLTALQTSKYWLRVWRNPSLPRLSRCSKDSDLAISAASSTSSPRFRSRTTKRRLTSNSWRLSKTLAARLKKLSRKRFPICCLMCSTPCELFGSCQTPMPLMNAWRACWPRLATRSTRGVAKRSTKKTCSETMLKSACAT